MSLKRRDCKQTQQPSDLTWTSHTVTPTDDGVWRCEHQIYLCNNRYSHRKWRWSQMSHLRLHPQADQHRYCLVYFNFILNFIQTAQNISPDLVCMNEWTNQINQSIKAKHYINLLHFYKHSVKGKLHLSFFMLKLYWLKNQNILLSFCFQYGCVIPTGWYSKLQQLIWC